MITIATIKRALFYCLEIIRSVAQTSKMVVPFTNAATDMLEYHTV